MTESRSGTLRQKSFRLVAISFFLLRRHCACSPMFALSSRGSSRFLGPLRFARFTSIPSFTPRRVLARPKIRHFLFLSGLRRAAEHESRRLRSRADRLDRKTRKMILSVSSPSGLRCRNVAVTVKGRQAALMRPDIIRINPSVIIFTIVACG